MTGMSLNEHILEIAIKLSYATTLSFMEAIAIVKTIYAQGYEIKKEIHGGNGDERRCGLMAEMVLYKPRRENRNPTFKCSNCGKLCSSYYNDVGEWKCCPHCMEPIEKERKNGKTTKLETNLRPKT